MAKNNLLPNKILHKIILTLVIILPTIPPFKAIHKVRKSEDQSSK